MQIPSTVIDLVIHFAVRQLAKFGASIDWTKVKADLDARVRALIPGEFLDEAAVQVMNKALDTIAALVKDEAELNKIIDLIQAKKLGEAFTELKNYVLAHI